MKVAASYDGVAARMYKDDPALVVEMLNACLEDGDLEELLRALRHLAKAFGGISTLASL